MITNNLISLIAVRFIYNMQGGVYYDRVSVMYGYTQGGHDTITERVTPDATTGRQLWRLLNGNATFRANRPSESNIVVFYPRRHIDVTLEGDAQ